MLGNQVERTPTGMRMATPSGPTLGITACIMNAVNTPWLPMSLCVVCKMSVPFQRPRKTFIFNFSKGHSALMIKDEHKDPCLLFSAPYTGTLSN